jgi:hypothetical protein
VIQIPLWVLLLQRFGLDVELTFQNNDANYFQ